MLATHLYSYRQAYLSLAYLSSGQASGESLTGNGEGFLKKGTRK